jgi:hypothetical protein
MVATQPATMTGVAGQVSCELVYTLPDGRRVSSGQIAVGLPGPLTMDTVGHHLRLACASVDAAVRHILDVAPAAGAVARHATGEQRQYDPAATTVLPAAPFDAFAPAGAGQYSPR